jgi:hypothetical protein
MEFETLEEKCVKCNRSLVEVTYINQDTEIYCTVCDYDYSDFDELELLERSSK